MTTALEALRGGRERILRGWTKGAFARDAGDFAVDATDPKATCWCIIGAIDAVAGEASDESIDALCALEVVLRGASVASFNDAPTTTRDDVVALFDHAIAEASR